MNEELRRIADQGIESAIERYKLSREVYSKMIHEIQGIKTLVDTHQTRHLCLRKVAAGELVEDRQYMIIHNGYFEIGWWKSSGRWFDMDSVFVKFQDATAVYELPTAPSETPKNHEN